MFWSWSKSSPQDVKQCAFLSQLREDGNGCPERRIWALSISLTHTPNVFLPKMRRTEPSYWRLFNNDSHRLCNNPDWHGDYALPYHMADWILCSGSVLWENTLNMEFVFCSMQNIARTNAHQMKCSDRHRFHILYPQCDVLRLVPSWPSKRDYSWLDASPHTRLSSTQPVSLSSNPFMEDTFTKS